MLDKDNVAPCYHLARMSVLFFERREGYVEMSYAKFGFLWYIYVFLRYTIVMVLQEVWF